MKTLPLLALAGVTLAACSGADHDAPAPVERTPARTYVVTADSVTTTIAIEGTVHARHRAEISTRLMARVTDVPVELGTAVRAGQIVIRLGIEDVAANRAKAEAAVSVAQAARDEAARHAARMDALLAEDVVPRVQRDQAHLGLTQAESQLAMAQATLREVETAAGYAQIAAPFDGVVVARTVDPGDLAAPGMPLLTIESRGGREAVLAVPPEAAAGLTEGAALDVAGRDGRTAKGRLRAVAGGADPMTRTVEIRVTIPADWPTGSSVTAFVPVGGRTAVTIPAEAVVRRGQLTGVHVVQGDLVLLRWVRLGRAVGSRVEVLSGLEAGEQIAL
ncbi:MAG TPA: efflux RND transporter periplasmic adaptor subunit [Gemmatimonadales bacterium]|nr:efflux RND transporter periplasmic adaptor subunit [Gemmatimonadales bacterium]